MLVPTHPTKELLSQLPMSRTQRLKKNRSVAPVKYALRAISLGVNGDCAGRSQNLVKLDIKLGIQPTLALPHAPPLHAQRKRTLMRAGKRVQSQSSTTRATPSARCCTKP